MESRIAISVSENRITVALSGEFDPLAVKETVAELLRHPDYRANMDALYDLRGLYLGAISTEQLQTLSFEIFDPSWDGTKFAMVTDDDDVYGLSRVYTAVASESGDQQRAVFRSIEAAVAWLDS
ncbi:MAG: hypothetical protein AAGG11_11925 [Pseudomonadota bacterium]